MEIGPAMAEGKKWFAFLNAFLIGSWMQNGLSTLLHAFDTVDIVLKKTVPKILLLSISLNNRSHSHPLLQATHIRYQCCGKGHFSKHKMKWNNLKRLKWELWAVSQSGPKLLTTTYVFMHTSACNCVHKDSKLIVIRDIATDFFPSLLKYDADSKTMDVFKKHNSRVTLQFSTRAKMLHHSLCETATFDARGIVNTWITPFL